MQFGPGVIVLRDFEIAKLLTCLLLAVARLNTYKTTYLLPTPMTVSLHYASIAQQILYSRLMTYSLLKGISGNEIFVVLPFVLFIHL